MLWVYVYFAYAHFQQLKHLLLFFSVSCIRHILLDFSNIERFFADMFCIALLHEMDDYFLSSLTSKSAKMLLQRTAKVVSNEESYAKKKTEQVSIIVKTSCKNTILGIHYLSHTNSSADIRMCWSSFQTPSPFLNVLVSHGGDRDYTRLVCTRPFPLRDSIKGLIMRLGLGFNRETTWEQGWSLSIQNHTSIRQLHLLTFVLDLETYPIAVLGHSVNTGLRKQQKGIYMYLDRPYKLLRAFLRDWTVDCSIAPVLINAPQNIM